MRKKLWAALCTFVFTLALGLGITLNANVTAQAATAQEVSITWAAIQHKSGYADQICVCASRWHYNA